MIYADLNFMEEKETTGRGRQSQVARGLEGGADAGLATRDGDGDGEDDEWCGRWLEIE